VGRRGALGTRTGGARDSTPARRLSKLGNLCARERYVWSVPPIAAIFPGQGSHAPDMDEPFRGHPTFEHGLELLGFDPFERLEEGTRFQQPAIFICSVAAWDAWRDDAPDEASQVRAAAGHSLGEYAALVAAGVLRFDDAVGLVAERGAAMADAGALADGTMLAMLGGDDHAIRGLAARLGLTIANDNAPGQLVLSGALDAVAQAEEVAREETGARARRLDVSGAFHSSLMQPAAAQLQAALARIDVQPGAFPVYANGTAAPFTDVRRELSENLLRGVRWRETLLALRTAGVERFVEHGPGAVLTGLVKRTLAAV
jgi:malonyl CoA-acyl carrier protein transacylase